MLVSLLAPINIVIQNIFLILVEDKSYTDFVENFKTHGLDTWDTTAMLILLNSGSVISPAYLFYLKDLGPKLTKFASLYCAKLNKLVGSGGLHNMNIIQHYLSLRFPLIGDIEKCCNDINIWYVLLSIFGFLIVAFFQAFWAIGLFWSSLYAGTLMRTKN